ncbi:hypothetical protein N6H18_13665 [Reichenbachiella agarivorans]|uniref:Uncharacterized protein n=1 Tax=Reichenbachiella agarivorans TaxID=2979464 RepID=A0ABY6CLK7_9BACT|nr:hypothetical protein [Reichenbachiella agarivorans]UXP31398.1 hypothetical protein N6H18_13665 [Reichenbachiella agarivorans]
MKIIIPFLAVCIALAGCNKENTTEIKENEVLQARIDSMQTILEVTQYRVSLLDQIGKYLDSIDYNRNWVKLNLEAGITNEDYVERMKNLSQYVQKAEWTIGELEKTRSAYASQVKRLKKEISEKDLEVKSLQQTIAQYQGENTDLKVQLTAKEMDLLDSQMELNLANHSIEEASTEITELLSTVRLTEAESFYAKGEGMEEVAKHIQLAPKRKNESLEQALSMYINAEKLGHPKAGAKIKALKEKLKIS